jgi:hypothetical protein
MLKHHIKCFGILLAFVFFMACSQKDEDMKVNATGPINFATSSQFDLANMPVDDGISTEIQTFSSVEEMEKWDREHGGEEAYPLDGSQEIVGATVQPTDNNLETSVTYAVSTDPLFYAIMHYLVGDESMTPWDESETVCVKPCTDPDVMCLCEKEMPALDYYRPKLQKSPVGNIQEVKDALQNGSDVNARELGKTPLMLAAMGNSPELINLLLDNGADINATDTFTGKTALDYAKEFDQKQTIKTLQQHGAK